MPRLLLGVLLLLLVPAFPVRAQGEVVLCVGAETVSRAEFEYYYKKARGKTPEAFAAALAELRLKVRLAEEMGLDTLPAFRAQWAYYRGKMLKPYLADTCKEEQEARLLYERGRRRHTGGWVRMAHISKYLPQQADERQERAARLLMDSVYAALQAGADFAELARRYSDDAGSRETGGVLPWMPVDRNVEEWVRKLAALEKDEVSAPFYSPLGIHVVKWLDRKPFLTYEERKPGLLEYVERRGAGSLAVCNEEWADDSLLCRKVPDWAYRMKELRDGLLAACLSRRLRQEGTDCGEAELERFFKQRRSEYAWKLPRYKGAVIHCKDKKTAKAVKRHLKKKPAGEWKAALERWASDNPGRQVKMEAGLFEIGENKYVDKLVFKCGAFEPLPGLPHTFVMGKKLKKGPEDYRDIKEWVLRDWRMARDEARMKELKQKYKVEINQEVLKTVNNNGSN